MLLKIFSEVDHLMSQNEWQSFCDSAKGVLPIYIGYAIGSLVLSFCTFLDRHYGKEAFSLAKFLIGMFRDLVWGLVLMCGGMWVGHNNHYLTAFIVSIGVLRGYRWTFDVIDTVLWKRYGVRRPEDECQQPGEKKDDK